MYVTPLEINVFKMFIFTSQFVQDDLNNNFLCFCTLCQKKKKNTSIENPTFDQMLNSLFCFCEAMHRGEY